MFSGFRVIFFLSAIIALNFSMLALVIQLDLFTTSSGQTKLLLWMMTAGCWYFAYKNLNPPPKKQNTKTNKRF